MKRVLVALLATVTCTQLQAQTGAPAPSGPPLTLERALEMAGAVAPSVQAATAGVRAAGAATTVAGLRPNPEVQGMTENISGSGAYRGVRSAETTVQVSYPLELGGKRPARVAVARAEETQARIGSAIADADLRLAVTQAYVEAAAAERRLVTAKQQAEIAANALSAAQIRVKAGRASPLEEQRADVLRVNADAAVERADRLLTVARGNLARRIGRPFAGNLDLDWFGRIGSYGPSIPVDGDSSLALASARAGVTTASAQVRLAQSQRIPNVTVAAAARQLRATNDVAAVFSVTVPLQVFNNGRAAVSQAQALREKAEAESRVAKLQIEQDMAEAGAEVANAETSAKAATGPAIAAAEEAARIARIGYREGKFGQLELLDAERTLADTRTAATDALANYQNARARLERLSAPAPNGGNQ